MYRSLFLSVALLSAPAALAQEDDVNTTLEGVGRLTIQSGWRLTSNNTFYEGYYGPNAGLARGPTSPGGPLVVGSFAYGITDSLELGIDLFATGERLRLTDQPMLSTLTYGALVGLRFQTVLDLGPQGLIPFVGVLTGPTLAFSQFEGQPAQEIMTQAWAGTVGATMRLSERWGLTGEYRLSFVRGPVGALGGRKFGSFNGGGNWFALGVTYVWPPEPSRGMGRSVGF